MFKLKEGNIKNSLSFNKWVILTPVFKKKNFQILFSNPSEMHAALESPDIPYIFCKEATEYPSTNDLSKYFLYPIIKVFSAIIEPQPIKKSFRLSLTIDLE